MKTKTIAVIVGSLRKESVNRKMAKELISMAPDSLKLDFLEIGDLQMYNEDFDMEPPVEWVNFRNKLSKFDGVLFVTPEYNRSIPAVLKNALDVASRPYGQSVWNGKPGAIVTVSPGAVGGFGANHHLRQILTFLNVFAMAQPEAYIGNAYGLFDESGKIKDKSTRDFLQGFMNSFSDWVAKF